MDGIKRLKHGREDTSVSLLFLLYKSLSAILFIVIGSVLSCIAKGRRSPFGNALLMFYFGVIP